MITKKICKLFLFFFIAGSVQSQCIFNEDYKRIIEETRLNFHKPDDYFCITPPSSYFEIHPGHRQSIFCISMINKDNSIMIGISPISYPKGVSKAEKFLIATQDMNHISKKALAAEMDIRFSNKNLIGVPQLKKMNADRAYVYNIKVYKLYLGIYPRCKKIEVYKDNIGRAEILFFYKENQEKIVREEINKTWGMIKFK
jgi:hypothetical protein